MIGANIRRNERASTIEFTRTPSNAAKNAPEGQIPKENVIYRIHPSLESSQLIYQLGTASPDLAVQAALMVAPYVAGIDVNAGCPKPFSTSGGMGAALLSEPELLCSILKRLVKDVGEKHEIGISVKIRLLKTEEETKMLVQQLCATGITGLTIHCRTRSMRKTEKAIRDQLRMVGDVCREAGVACLMNGDVETREQAEQLAADFGVDGAMIATCAEKDPSVFRSTERGGKVHWKEIINEYMKAAMTVENRWANTKFLLAQMMPGKEQSTRGLSQARNYEHVCELLDLNDLKEKARALDELLGMTDRMTKAEQKAKTKAEMRAKTAAASNQTDVQEKKSNHRSSPGNKHDEQPSKRQKRNIPEHSDYHTDLHKDIVAPSLTV